MGSQQFGWVHGCAVMKGFKLFLVLALRKPRQSASLKRMVVSLSTAGVRYIAKFLPGCTLIAVSLAFSLCCLKSRERRQLWRVRVGRGEAVERCGKQDDWSCTRFHWRR